MFKMKELEQIYFNRKSTFRSWLQENHDQSSGIWIVFYMKRMQ